MNEPAFVDRIRRALDDDLDQLPRRIALHLTLARHAALAQIPAQPIAAPPIAAGFSLHWLAIPLTGVLLIAGLSIISNWSDTQRAEELAALDIAIVADDIPLAIYADPGFGVYLRNTSR